MARRIARTTALTPDFDWHTRDDVHAALSALRRAPLPDVHFESPPEHFFTVMDAFKRAYASHPVVVAAETWSRNEVRAERSFRIFSDLVNLRVHAARRWRAEQSEPTPF